MLQVQKVFMQHEFLYASKSLIPLDSLDGKDVPTVFYIVIEEPITEAHSQGYFLHYNEAEAQQAITDGIIEMGEYLETDDGFCSALIRMDM